MRKEDNINNSGGLVNPEELVLAGLEEVTGGKGYCHKLVKVKNKNRYGVYVRHPGVDGSILVSGNGDNLIPLPDEASIGENEFDFYTTVGPADREKIEVELQFDLALGDEHPSFPGYKHTHKKETETKDGIPVEKIDKGISYGRVGTV